MLLRRYHDTKQEVQAVEKPPVAPVEEKQEVEEKPKTKRRTKKGDVD